MARRPVCPSLVQFASLSIVLFSLGVAVPAMAEGGNGGYEYCYTNYPGATGYVAGQPTYISAVFHFPGDSYNGPKLFDYVKQHYGVANPGPVGCSYGSKPEQAQNGLTAALGKIKAGGFTVIETGWTLNGAPAIASSTPAQVQTAAAPAAQGGGKYGYCYVNYPGSPGYAVSQPTYMSGVLQYPENTYDGSGFAAYVQQQYGATTPAGCSYGMPLRDAQLYINRDAAKFRSTGPGNRTVIQTGWSLSGSAAAAAAPSPAAAAPASPYTPRGAGAAASAAAPAAVKSYTFCTVAAGKNYVSAVMPDPNPHMDGVNAFRAYLKQKYNPPSAIPLPSCGTYDSLDYANKMFHQWVLTEGASLVQTGWTYNGSAAAPTVAAAAMPATPAAAAPAPSAPPVQGTITVRLVDPVNSFTDPPGKRYRAVVTQAVTIGNVNIPIDTLSTVTVSGSPGNLSAHLTTLAPNGQQPLNVTTSAVTPLTAGSNAAMAAAAAGAKQVQSIMSIGGFGKKAAAPKAVSVMAQGDKVVLPPGTTLSFTTLVPQSSTSTPAPAPSNGQPTL